MPNSDPAAGVPIYFSIFFCWGLPPRSRYSARLAESFPPTMRKGRGETGALWSMGREAGPAAVLSSLLPWPSTHQHVYIQQRRSPSRRVCKGDTTWVTGTRSLRGSQDAAALKITRAKVDFLGEFLEGRETATKRSGRDDRTSPATDRPSIAGAEQGVACLRSPLSPTY